MDCQIKKRYPKYFPKSFISTPSKKRYLSCVEDKKKAIFLQKITLPSYRKNFSKRPSFYDLHGLNFQNFALKSTNKLSGTEIQKLAFSSKANRRLIRARVYAISSRKDVGWDGKLLTEEEDILKKQKEMAEYSDSLKLYDWSFCEKKMELPEVKYKVHCKLSVIRKSTQDVVSEMFEKHSDLKIGWVNLANAHHVCGAYSLNLNGSQEENVATMSNGCALLGMCGDFVTSGARYLAFGKWAEYKPNFHIPPYGNYFCKTKFLTGKNHVDCYMIASAFCDFRRYIPFTFEYTERSTYFNIWGKVRDEKKLIHRLRSDIEGTVKTAVLEGIDVLVAGASGCGAFRHDPKRESELWKEVIKKYGCHFKEVVFAILDSKESKNIKEFTKTFPNKNEEKKIEVNVENEEKKIEVNVENEEKSKEEEIKGEEIVESEN